MEEVVLKHANYEYGESITRKLIDNEKKRQTMSRLTRHLENDDVFSCDEKTFIKCYKKLSQIEDIEDELSIDWATVFKALKEGFYYRYINDCRPQEILFADPDNEFCGIDLDSDGSGFLTWADVIVAHIEDYGKTWALTKEELK